MSNVKSVEIACNALKGEVVTTVTHITPEMHHLGDPCDTRQNSEGKVRIALRTFYAYGRTPGDATASLARYMAKQTMLTMPGVPVALYGA